MIGRTLSIALVLACLAVSGPADAKRTANYSVDDAEIMKWGLEQNLNPISAMPVKSVHNVTLEIAPGVDHEVIRGGIYCSAWKITNPISQMITKAATLWDNDDKLAGTTDAPDLKISVERANTLTRCVSTGELVGTCITRVIIDAQVTQGSAPPRPIHTMIERGGKLGGFCGGIAQSVAVVSRETVIALIKAASETEKAVVAAPAL